MRDSITADALVLRRADYGDYDRMLTLLTPDYGKIDAIARGCRKLKSQLLNAAEPFCTGQYQLILTRDRYSVAQCRISENFYALRGDYDRLSHGAYWLKLLYAVSVPDAPNPDLFLMALRALAHLNYGEIDARLLTAMFEMQLARLIGIAPNVSACVKCQKPVIPGAPVRFDARAGGVACEECASDQPRLGEGARRILLKAPFTRFDAVSKLTDHPDWPEAAARIRAFLSQRVSVNGAPPGI